MQQYFTDLKNSVSKCKHKYIYKLSLKSPICSCHKVKYIKILTALLNSTIPYSPGECPDNTSTFSNSLLFNTTYNYELFAFETSKLILYFLRI